MRTLLATSLLICAFAFVNTGAIPVKRNLLNGTWVPVSQEIGGRKLPAAAFEKQQLILNDSNYTVVAESVDKGTVSYNGNQMDIYGKEGVNTGKHFTAIYKFADNHLIVCYNLKGDRYPETFETTGKPLFFLSVFKRAG